MNIDLDSAPANLVHHGDLPAPLFERFERVSLVNADRVDPDSLADFASQHAAQSGGAVGRDLEKLPINDDFFPEVRVAPSIRKRIVLRVALK
jgi:hypothetical protein